MQSSRSLQSQSHRQLADTLHRVMEQYGYIRVETPVIQPADIFLTKAGDQIVSRLFTFERNGQQLALRPEFTATAARDYAMGAANGKPIARWQFSGLIFEDDPSHASVGYQRYSIGAELIGLGGALADAEIVNMALQGIDELGIHRWRLVIGHVGLMRLLLTRFNLDPRTQRFLLNHLPALKDPALGKAYVLERLGKLILSHESENELSFGDSAELDTQQILDALLDATQSSVTMGGRTRHDIVRRLMQKRQRASEYGQIVQALDFLEQWGRIDASPVQAFETVRAMIGTSDAEAERILAAWQQMIDLLDTCAVPIDRIHVQPDLARSWDYYSGVVFEIYTEDGLHLAGGGRYDGLSSLVGGQRNVPAVGFVYYPDQILPALSESPASDETGLVIVVDSNAEASGMRWAHSLRKRGWVVEVLPSEQSAGNNTALRVTSDGHLWHGQNHYTPDMIDSLIADLKRA